MKEASESFLKPASVEEENELEEENCWRDATRDRAAQREVSDRGREDG